MGKLRHEEGRNGSRPDLGVVVEPGADPRLLALLQAQFLGHIAVSHICFSSSCAIFSRSFSQLFWLFIAALSPCFTEVFSPLRKVNASLFYSRYLKPSQFSLTLKK